MNVKGLISQPLLYTILALVILVVITLIILWVKGSLSGTQGELGGLIRGGLF